MLLATDIGNTNIVFGVYSDDVLVENWRIETDSRKSSDEYGLLLSGLFNLSKIKIEDIDQVIISTVVPSALFTFQHMIEVYFDAKTIVVEPGIKTGLSIKYNDPAQVGSDRIVNAVSALNKYGGPAVIIDIGTATTFCAVNENWEYLGGTISPGLKISSDALFEKTAKLPKIEIESPGEVICKNTSEAIQSGVVYGHTSMIEGIISKMKNELIAKNFTKNKEIKVIATGGFTSLISNECPSITIFDRFLTLDGLNYIYKKNA